MAKSAAAIAGIEFYGHGWRLEISLRGQPKSLGDEESLRVGDCIKIRDSIVADVRRFLNSRAAIEKLNESTREDIEEIAADLADCADDIDELREVLGRLYDEFDYHRICVVA